MRPRCQPETLTMTVKSNVKLLFGGKPWALFPSNCGSSQSTFADYYVGRRWVPPPVLWIEVVYFEKDGHVLMR